MSCFSITLNSTLIKQCGMVSDSKLNICLMVLLPCRHCLCQAIHPSYSLLWAYASGLCELMDNVGDLKLEHLSAMLNHHACK